MKPQIDKLYVYKPTENNIALGTFSKLNVLKQEMHFKRGVAIEQSEEVYRYAKTVKINGNDRTLLMITLDKNKQNVSKFFTNSKNEIESNEKHMGIFLEADEKPLELDITYIY